MYLIHNTGELNNGYVNDNSYVRSSYPLINELYGTFIDSDVEHNDSFSNYPIHLLETKYYANVPIKINGFLLLSIFIIIYIIVYTIVSDKKKFLNNSLLLALLAVLYVIALQFAYYIIFSEAEAINHNSLERYIGTMCIPLLYYIFYALYTDHRIYNNKKIIVISTAILLIFTPITPILNATILFNAHNSQLQKEVKNQKGLTEFVNYYTDKNSRIFAVHQTQSKDSILLQFRYFMTPRMIPVVSEFKDDGLIAKGKFNTAEEWANELYDRYDYVLVINSDEYFDNNFNSLFEDKKVEGWTLYSIEKNEKKHSVLLKKVRSF
ncbi:MAG: hypothetical protein K6C11_03630 [Bacilli bacterium]|nr:hypothetical protein [Bacilli bacterium]